MNKKLHIFVEQFPNHDFRQFHVSVPVCVREFSSWETEKKPKAVIRLERALKKLPHIADDSIVGLVSRKSIKVKLNKAFQWDDVIDAVVGVLRQYFKREYKITDVSVTVQPRAAWMDKPARDDDDMY